VHLADKFLQPERMPEYSSKGLHKKYRHLPDIGDNVQASIAKVYYGITIHSGGVPQRLKK